MFPCPGCGDNLRFDIPTQQMHCRSCGGYFDVMGIKEETLATENSEEEKDFFETTVFSCPQCGGEMIGDETDATMVCSYCGANNVLETRLSKEKRPNYIIPFKVTREAAKEALTNKLKKNLFAPGSYKKIDKIDSFRAIYVPYFAYNYTYNNPLAINAVKSRRSGDYIIKDNFRINSYLRGKYLGLSRDASSSFYDDVAGAVGPFDVRDTKHFHSGFLSGFYADIADVPNNIYSAETKEIAEADIEKRIEEFGKQQNTGEVTVKKADHPVVPGDRDLMMYPVWFLTYKIKNRVAYATVNGQSGKVAADIPISFAKLTAFSLLLSALIFGFLNYVINITLKPNMVLGIAAVLLALVVSFYYHELMDIYVAENNIFDEGLYAVDRTRKSRFDQVDEPKKKRAKKKSDKSERGNNIVAIIVLLMVGYDIVIFAGVALASVVSSPMILCLISAIWQGINIKRFWKRDYIEGNGKLLTGISIIATLLGSAVVMSNTFIDEAYYGVTIAGFAVLVLLILEIIRQLPRLTTRPLPQFKKTGGDDGGI